MQVYVFGLIGVQTMSKVIIQTIAFNAEKTIRRCADSVISQTYCDIIEWNVLDNGSTDKTLGILKEYEGKHSFIHIFHIESNCSPHTDNENQIWDTFAKRLNIQMDDNDYYCTLDADDEYCPRYIEELVSYSIDKNLDIVVSGVEFINAETKTTIGFRKLPIDLTISSPSDFSNKFPVYHSFMRPVWGKIFKGKLLNGYVRNEQLTYGSDTFCVFFMLSNAERVGILEKSLYKYYVSKKSVSYTFDSNRINSDCILFYQAYDFLTTKVGYVSAQNLAFLYQVYINAIRDTINVLLKANIPNREKFAGLRKIFSNKITQNALSSADVPFDMRKELVESILEVVSQFGETRKYEDAIWLGVNLSAMLEYQDQYIRYSIMNIAFLVKNNRFDEAKSELDEWQGLLPDNSEFVGLRRSLEQQRNRIK